MHSVGGSKPEPASSGPIETKVKAATAAAAVASLIVSLLVLQAPGLRDLEQPLQSVLVALFTSIFTWIAGFLAKHTYRPIDPPPARRI